MHIPTRGLITKVVKYSDTSLIITVYSRDLGLQSYMMKGVRSSKAKGRGNVLQPMNFIDMEVVIRENKNLQNLREFKPALVYQKIPFDMSRTAMGTFMLEVINASVKEEESQPDLFDFLYSGFQFLDGVDAVSPLFHLKFMLSLCSHLGFMPMDNYERGMNELFAMNAGQYVSDYVKEANVIEEGLSYNLHLLMNTKVQALEQLDFNKQERAALLDMLEQYYKLHLMDFKAFRTPGIFSMVFGGHDD